MIVECTPQLPQNGSPNCPKSLSGTSRSPAGMHPVNWLRWRSSHHRLVRLPNSAGISPVNWFPWSQRDCRLARLPNSAGISPVNWLLERRTLACGHAAG